MIRKASLLLTGAVFGAIGAVSLTQIHVFTGGPANAAASDTYRSLNLFGDVFERVRADYVEVPDDNDAHRVGDQRNAQLARSAFELYEPEELQGHAGPDERQVRRARHRSHHGGGRHQGRVADRRYARGQGRHPRQRPDHGDRRRDRPGHDAQPGGRQDARRRSTRRSRSPSNARASTSRSTSSSSAPRSPSSR